MDGKTVQATRTDMSELMQPPDANIAGTVFGGKVLAMCDSVAYVCAARHAGPNCVTVSVDRVDFHEPVRIGELVTLCAMVNYVGTSSMEIGITVIAEDLKTGAKRHTNSCYITMVHLDAQGKPTAVPPLRLETDAERQRFQAGEERRRQARATREHQPAS